MVLAASIADVKSIAKQEALIAGQKILGITASKPRYVLIPDDDDPDAVNEFVVDVHLIEGPSQAILIGQAGGLVLLKNVIIAHEAVGPLITDLNVPVELQKSVTGQLQVVGRAKVTLSTIHVNEYTYKSLGLCHVAELERDANGILRDPFGVQVSDSDPSRGPMQSVSIVSTTRLSTADELNKDLEGNDILLGVNEFSRTISVRVRSFEIVVDEGIRVTETEGIV